MKRKLFLRLPEILMPGFSFEISPAICARVTAAEAVVHFVRALCAIRAGLEALPDPGSAFTRRQQRKAIEVTRVGTPWQRIHEARVRLGIEEPLTEWTY